VLEAGFSSLSGMEDEKAKKFLKKIFS